METREVKVQSIASYKGHSLKESGSITLNLKFRYDELVKVIGLTQMLNNDVRVAVKMGSSNAIKLGMFRVSSINIEDDGDSTVKLNGTNDHIEVDNLNELVTKESFRVLFAATVEIEGEEESE